MAQILPFTKRDTPYHPSEPLNLYLPDYFVKALNCAKENSFDFVFLKGNIYCLEDGMIQQDDN